MGAIRLVNVVALAKTPKDKVTIDIISSFIKIFLPLIRKVIILSEVEVLVENYPAKLTRMGMKDCFGKSGKASELLEYFGLTCKDIVDEVKK